MSIMWFDSGRSNASEAEEIATMRGVADPAILPKQFVEWFGMYGSLGSSELSEPMDIGILKEATRQFNEKHPHISVVVFECKGALRVRFRAR